MGFFYVVCIHGEHKISSTSNPSSGLYASFVQDDEANTEVSSSVFGFSFYTVWIPLMLLLSVSFSGLLISFLFLPSSSLFLGSPQLLEWIRLLAFVFLKEKEREYNLTTISPSSNFVRHIMWILFRDVVLICRASLGLEELLLAAIFHRRKGVTILSPKENYELRKEFNSL